MTYDYGDELVCKMADETGHLIPKPCAVVGITTVTNEEQARVLGHPLGTILYSVEFGDGTDALLLEERLERLS
jgi:hypothetical protein